MLNNFHPSLPSVKIDGVEYFVRAYRDESTGKVILPRKMPVLYKWQDYRTSNGNQRKRKIRVSKLTKIYQTALLKIKDKYDEVEA